MVCNRLDEFASIDFIVSMVDEILNMEPNMEEATAAPLVNLRVLTTPHERALEDIRAAKDTELANPKCVFFRDLTFGPVGVEIVKVWVIV